VVLSLAGWLPRSLALGLGLATAACSARAFDPHAAAAEITPTEPTRFSVPSTADAFVEQLLPSPAGGVRLVYDVHGPLGLHGSMEMLAWPGNYRHQRWSLRNAEGEAPFEGTWVQTPRVQWSRSGNNPPTMVPQPLGAIADAYAALPAEVRALVAYHVGQWHAQVELGREKHPGETATYAGQSCLRNRVASHEVCVWEDPALVLAYRSEAFRVEVRSLEPAPAFDLELFEVPEGAQIPADAPRTGDPRATALALARGDFAAISSLFRPALLLASTEG